ncbi:MAG: hypothetical protein JNK35_01530 [Phycisphaerae bacterium]|nr:hypothetical protein [Phycisphaerae bacterium]
MGVLTGLVIQLRDAVGRAFLQAGLLPALVASLVLWCHAKGFKAVPEFLEQFRSTDAGQVTASAFSLLVGVGAAALACFASRSLCLRFWTELPIPPLRRALRGRRLRAWASVRRKNDRAIFSLSAVRWLNRDAQGSSPPGDPRDARPSAHVLFAEATAGIDALRAVLTWDDPIARCTPGAVRAIARGAEAVCRLHHADPDAAAGFERAWRRLVGGESGATVKPIIEAAVRQCWMDIETRTRRFPETPESIEPTRLGSRVRALDDYGKLHHGMSTSTLWPLLEALLDKDHAAAARARGSLLAVQSFTVTATAIMTVAAVVAMDWLLALGVRTDASLAPHPAVTLVAAILLAWLAYEAAIVAFDEAASQIRVVLDLEAQPTLLKHFGSASTPRTPEAIAFLRALAAEIETADPQI